MNWQPMETAPRDGTEFVWLRRITIVAVGKPATYEFHACVMHRRWIAEERGLPREGEGFWMARYGGSVPDMDARHGWWAPLPTAGVPGAVGGQQP
jgi:hypothetical protein